MSRPTNSSDREAERRPHIKRAGHPDLRHLSPVERSVFDWFLSPARLADVFQSKELPAQLSGHCIAYEQRLHHEQLLTPAMTQQYGRQLFVNGACVIGGLGGYKLLVALSKGYSNIWFLIIMAGAGLALLRWICRAPRVSHRGQAYVKQMQLVFERLKERTTKSATAIDPAFSLLVSVFGVSMLAGTLHDNYAQLLREKATNASASGGSWGRSWVGGCGGGCGSCGGGGCGGGCGGCGG